MSDPAFPSPVSAALDRLTVPPLPQGFADRLAARIEAGNLPADSATIAPPLPSTRRRFGGSGWRRSGGIIAIAATFSLATATAAASGFFGEPVYVPVVSDALAKAKLVELPERQPAKIEARPVAVETRQETPAIDAPPTANGREAVRNLYRQLHNDPQYRALPRQERIKIAREEIRSMLQNGQVTLPELRHALAEHRLRANPALRQKMRRELARQEMRGPVAADAPKSDATALADQRAAPPIRDAVPDASMRPSLADRREAYTQLSPDQQQRVRELRQQLRTATPAERRAIREELQAIWQKRADQPGEEKITPASEGNDPVTR